MPTSCARSPHFSVSPSFGPNIPIFQDWRGLFLRALSGWPRVPVAGLVLKEAGGGAKGRNGRSGSSPVLMVAGLVKRQTTVNERIWDSRVR